MVYELREYSFGETIGKGFNLYFNNFLQILIVSLLCQIPLFLLMKNTNIFDPEEITFSANLVQRIIVYFANLLTQLILSIWITYFVSKKFLDDVSIPNIKPVKIIPLFIRAIMLSIAVALATILGFVALIIPGIIITLGYTVATNVLVIEGKSVWQSMKRSWYLTKGERGPIFGLIFVTGLIVGCIATPLAAVSAVFLAKNPEWMAYLNRVISALVEPIDSCVTVVIYFNLRIKKEGFNIEHLTKQFSLADDYSPAVEG